MKKLFILITLLALVAAPITTVVTAETKFLAVPGDIPVSPIRSDDDLKDRLVVVFAVFGSVDNRRIETYALYDGGIILNDNEPLVALYDYVDTTDNMPHYTVGALSVSESGGTIPTIPVGINNWQELVSRASGWPDYVTAAAPNSYKEGGGSQEELVLGDYTVVDLAHSLLGIWDDDLAYNSSSHVIGETSCCAITKVVVDNGVVFYDLLMKDHADPSKFPHLFFIIEGTETSVPNRNVMDYINSQ